MAAARPTSPVAIVTAPTTLIANSRTVKRRFRKDARIAPLDMIKSVTNASRTTRPLPVPHCINTIHFRSVCSSHSTDRKTGRPLPSTATVRRRRQLFLPTSTLVTLAPAWSTVRTSRTTPNFVIRIRIIRRTADAVLAPNTVTVAAPTLHSACSTLSIQRYRLLLPTHPRHLATVSGVSRRHVIRTLVHFCRSRIRPDRPVRCAPTLQLPALVLKCKRVHSTGSAFVALQPPLPLSTRPQQAPICPARNRSNGKPHN
jgi:hypothetical protein